MQISQQPAADWWACGSGVTTAEYGPTRQCITGAEKVAVLITFWLLISLFVSRTSAVSQSLSNDAGHLPVNHASRQCAVVVDAQYRILLKPTSPRRSIISSSGPDRSTTDAASVHLCIYTVRQIASPAPRKTRLPRRPPTSRQTAVTSRLLTTTHTAQSIPPARQHSALTAFRLKSLNYSSPPRGARLLRFSSKGCVQLHFTVMRCTIRYSAFWSMAS